MAAWVIRAEREGEPTDAFQVEEIEVPKPGVLATQLCTASRADSIKVEG
jgi:hypothetical protein